MIYDLRKKFILISAVSVSIVFAVIFGVIYGVSSIQLNRTMDMFTDMISSNDGRFPNYEEMQMPQPQPMQGFQQENFFTPDTPFSTRFFIVWADEADDIIRTDIEMISSVSEEEAEEYAKDVLKGGKERGWVSNYRYKVSELSNGKSVVFVNGEVNRTTTFRLIYLLFSVMVGSLVVILLLIILISKWAVKPVAESYDKQRQFVTDANHELKTPLTLILSNIDIVESEIGKNEWLDDVRSEGIRMGGLINQLVVLSRMDEDEANLTATEFDLSNMVSDVVSEFEGIARERQKGLQLSVQSDMNYTGDEGLIRRLVAILLDNAIKYCDPAGQIKVELYTKGRSSVLTVENTYKNVENVELGKLFDRFYKADKARTYTGSFGIGLSIAKGIAKKHKGDIVAYKKDATHIGFKVTLK